LVYLLLLGVYLDQCTAVLLLRQGAEEAMAHLFPLAQRLGQALDPQVALQQWAPLKAPELQVECDADLLLLLIPVGIHPASKSL
jgi:hypothetical protein